MPVQLAKMVSHYQPNGKHQKTKGADPNFKRQDSKRAIKKFPSPPGKNQSFKRTACD